MIEVADIKVGTLLKFIDDEARKDFINEAICHPLLVDLYYDKSYFEVFEKGTYEIYVSEEGDNYIHKEELKYFKIMSPEQTKLSEAAELIKDLVSGHEFDSSYINAGMRMRVNKFLRSIGEK